MTDFTKLKEDLGDPLNHYGRYTKLRRAGRNQIGCCPLHNEKTPSFNVYPDGGFYCFGCGKNGDVIHFLKEVGMTLDQIKELAGGINVTFKQFKPLAKVVDTWTQIPPLEPMPEPIYHGKKPDNIYYYHDADGKVLGAICRFNELDGKKQVRPFTYCTNLKGKSGWRWQGFDEPRPLYNLHSLKANRYATVFLVEGEKAADSAIRFFPEMVVSTWIGGTNGWSKTHWAPLFGRRIVLNPDSDEPGYKCMEAIGEMLKANGCIVEWLTPYGTDKGWDWADFRGDIIAAGNYYRAARQVWI